VSVTPLPFETLPGRPQRSGLGAFLIGIGAVLMVVGFFAPSVAMVLLESGEEGVEVILLAIIFLAGLFVGVKLIGLGRRMRAMPAVERLAVDTRPPVGFLRSFDDDDLLDPTPRMVPLGDFFPRRYEESLVRPLEKLGPMVSIGRPGNNLPMLGGCRFFVADQHWQTAVDYLRRRAAAVVLMIGRTEGLWWEIESSIRVLAPEKLLFFFPYVEEPKRRLSIAQRFFGYRPAQLPLSKKAYRRMEDERQARYRIFRERVQPLLSAELPDVLGSSQFIDVDLDGRVRTLETHRPWWQPLAIATPSVRMMTMNLRRTLRPFVQKLGH